MRRKKPPSHRRIRIVGPIDVNAGEVYVVEHGDSYDRGVAYSQTSRHTSNPASFDVCMALARECKSPWVHVKYVGPQQQKAE